MPLIDLKSELSLKRQTQTIGNSAFAVASAHADRLVELLTSSKGAEFAAKQVLLDPKTALRRLAAISKQMVVGFGIPGTGYEDKGSFRSVFNNTYNIPSKDGTVVSATLPISPTYYYNKDVTARIDSEVYTPPDAIKDEMDIVPFYFTTYKLTGGAVEVGDSLMFRSFFSSIQDSTTGNWNSFNYTGRGEMFYIFNSRVRSMNFSFKVAAFNYEQLLVLHEKLNVLRSFTSPTYNENGYMQGNFFKLTIGSFAKSLPGIPTNVSFSITDNVPWEVGDRENLLPHVIDVSVQFTVLEDKTPQFIQPTV